MTKLDGPSLDLERALRREGIKDVDSSTLGRTMYSRDASLYRVVPRVIVRPAHVEEIFATLKVAQVQNVPITLRGAGTSVAGNAIGHGIIVDTSRYLNRVLEIDPISRSALVEPGTVHATLQQTAVEHGLRFGPDPSTHSRCTVGGMIGNNACGSRSLAYGRTVDNVESLEVLTGAGEYLELGSGANHGSTVRRVSRLVDSSMATVRSEFGRFQRQLSGYSLEHMLPENGRRLDRLLVGSEGTLAVVLKARVSLVEDLPFRVLTVLGYPSIVEAADAVPALVEYPLIACEGLDQRMIDVVMRYRSDVPYMPRGTAFLLAEVAANTKAEALAMATAVAVGSGAVGHRVIADAAEQNALWRIREDGAGLASRSLEQIAHPGWEDAAVPPRQLGAYLRDFEDRLAEYGYDGLIYGHFGEGCVHVRIDFDPAPGGNGNSRFRTFLEEAAALVASYGGTLSGEHGDGRARSELLPAMYSAEAIGLFRAVKLAFDPNNLLNPGVIVDPAPIDADLQRQPGSEFKRKTVLRLVEDGRSMGAAVHRCIGVGRCIADNTVSGGIMCPSFVATRDEKDSTRGRARVLQEMLSGELIRGGWRSIEVQAALDLCLACKGCLTDCPTGVDMATYKAEGLQQRYHRRLRPRSHYVLGRLPRWARFARPFASIVNRILGARLLQRGAKAVAGIDSRRGMPRFAVPSLSKWSKKKRVVPDRPDVVVWADSFTEHFAPGPGQAAVTLLENAGLRVSVVGESACCGLTWFSTGQLLAAQRIVRHTLDVLHPYVAAGIPIVGLEPSCVAALRSDLVQLSDDHRAVEVAGGVKTLAEVLESLPTWSPPDLSGITVIAQPHCHHAAVMGWDADERLLARAGANVGRVSGCCGLAGNFGMEKGHYEISVAIAEHGLLPAVRARAPSTIVLADGFSCRVQLEDLADVRALHLAELLVGSGSSDGVK